MITLDPAFNLEVSKTIQLELLKLDHADEIFSLITENRSYLRKWLPWVDRMRSLSEFRQFIKESNHRAGAGLEIGCVIRYQQHLAGRAGIYNIDREKATATIGYWVAEAQQGKGIITCCCQALIRYAFEVLQLENIEIRCATDNHRSSAIAERLNFCMSHTIKNGEFFNHRYVDLHVYSLEKTAWVNHELASIRPNAS